MLEIHKEAISARAGLMHVLSIILKGYRVLGCVEIGVSFNDSSEIELRHMIPQFRLAQTNKSTAFASERV
jgi:hypothetical protein